MRHGFLIFACLLLLNSCSGGTPLADISKQYGVDALTSATQLEFYARFGARTKFIQLGSFPELLGALKELKGTRIEVVPTKTLRQFGIRHYSKEGRLLLNFGAMSKSGKVYLFVTVPSSTNQVATFELLHNDEFKKILMGSLQSAFGEDLLEE